MTIRSIACAALVGGLLAGIGGAEAMPVATSGSGLAPTVIEKADVVVVKKRVVRRPHVVVTKKVIR